MSQAVVIAVGVRGSGERVVLAVGVGASEEGSFWRSFLRSRVARGVRGVQLVISVAHVGRLHAIAAVLTGAGWQRCRVHVVRNALAPAPKSAAEMVAAEIRTVLAEPEPASAQQR